MYKKQIAAATLLSFVFPLFAYTQLSTARVITESEWNQLKMFRKILEKKDNYKILSEAEKEHTKGAVAPIVVAIAAGAGAAGADAIIQIATTGEINYWEVASSVSGAFVGTLTGGLMAPVTGAIGEATVASGVGVVVYNLTNNLQAHCMSIANAMAETARELACGGCHA